MAISRVLGALLCFCSCNEKRPKLVDDKMYTFIHFEWNCSNRWRPYRSDEELKSALKQHFTDSFKVEIHEIEIFTPTCNCDSCGCFRDIYVKALGKYARALNSGDFRLSLKESDEMYDYVYHVWKCDKRWSSFGPDEKLTDEELKNAVLRYFIDSCRVKIDEIDV